MQNISIVLADEQYLIRVGLKHLLQQKNDISVVAEATNSDALSKAVEKYQPNVVIIDYHTTKKNFCIDNISLIKTISPKSQVLVISSDDNKQHILQAISAGTNAFLTKSCDKSEIISAIYAANRGERFFCNKVLDIILEKHLSNTDTFANCAPSALTARELEVVELIAQGITTKEISKKLFLSHHTIYTHRRNIMKKLNVKSASELILYAVKTGLVKLD
ncbi:MAG: LuxR C-terminal-related transcriptional regulator [Chitinophagales bacterium]